MPGQYYNNLLEKDFHLEEKHKWLNHCFEFVEVAIHPSYRKQGLGKNTAILTTQVNNIAARSLYESLNWKVLKEPFFPSDKNNPFGIMGKELG
ncbi:GNAT family N-acetyltransferase [Heyndrickxia sporothermodurans]